MRRGRTTIGAGGGGTETLVVEAPVELSEAEAPGEDLGEPVAGRR